MMRTEGLTPGEEVMPTAICVELELSEAKFIQVFQRLSPGRRGELLDKLQALREPILRTVPAQRLYALTGLISLGGNALADTEALYDGNSSR